MFVSDNLLEVFRFLSRSDLDLLNCVSRQFHTLIDGSMRHVCLRRINAAFIQFVSDSQGFTTKVKVADNSECVVKSDALAEAVEHFMRLTSSAVIEHLHMTGLNIDHRFAQYFTTSVPTLCVQQVIIRMCKMMDADASLLPLLVGK